MDFDEDSEEMELDGDLPSAMYALQQGNPAVPPPGFMMAPGAHKRGNDDGTERPFKGAGVETPPFKKARSSTPEWGFPAIHHALVPKRGINADTDGPFDGAGVETPPSKKSRSAAADWGFPVIHHAVVPKRVIDDDKDGPFNGAPPLQMPPFKKARSSAPNLVVNQQAPVPTCTDGAVGVPRVASMRNTLAMPVGAAAADSFSALIANYMLRMREEDRLELQDRITVCKNKTFK